MTAPATPARPARRKHRSIGNLLRSARRLRAHLDRYEQQHYQQHQRIQSLHSATVPHTLTASTPAELRKQSDTASARAIAEFQSQLHVPSTAHIATITHPRHASGLAGTAIASLALGEIKRVCEAEPHAHQAKPSRQPQPRSSHSHSHSKRQPRRLIRPLRKRPKRSPSYYQRRARRQQQRVEQQQQQQAKQQRPTAIGRLSAAGPVLCRLMELFVFSSTLALALVMQSRNLSTSTAFFYPGAVARGGDFAHV